MFLKNRIECMQMHCQNKTFARIQIMRVLVFSLQGLIGTLRGSKKLIIDTSPQPTILHLPWIKNTCQQKNGGV